MSGYFAGIDIGSTMTKAVIMDGDDILSSIIGPTGAEHRRLAHRVMEKVLDRAGILLNDITCIVATGYGRISVPFADKQITEISCHARGVAHLFPEAGTVIDIGGQDSKVIKVAHGRVMDFVMNDKCAAGTGRFLEVIAEGLSLDIEEMGAMSLTSENPARISNVCTIFAEQEVADRLSEGVPLNDLVAGIHESMATRIYRMAQKLRVEEALVITGGGAKNAGLIKSLSDKFSLPVLLPPEPLLTGALGAALKGKDLAGKESFSAKVHRRLESATFFQGPKH